MRILVIGASGFVGSSLKSAIVDAGHTAISALRRPEREHLRDDLGVSLDDLLDDPTCLANQPYIDAVVHAAGLINGTRTELEEANAGLTNRIVEMMRRIPDARLIYISSVSAIDELGEYGLAKRQSERIIIDSGVKKFTIFRPSLLYGHGDDKNVAMLERLVKMSPLIPVPGGNLVDFQPLYVEDLGALVLQAAQTQAPAQSIYTVAGPAQVGLLDMLKAISSAMGRRTFFIPFPLAILKQATYFFDKLFPSLRLPVQQVSQLHKHEPWDISDAVRDFEFSPRTFQEGVVDMMNKARSAKS